MSSPSLLATLPKELLTSIALLLDQRSAIALSLTARALTEPALHRIWRDIDLSLHPHHGEYPLIRPLSHRDEGYCDWAQGEAKRAEDRHRLAVKERVKAGLQIGGAKLSMIKKLKIVPRVGANSAIVTFLDLIAPNLTELELRAPQEHIFQRKWRTRRYDAHNGLWFKMLDFDVVGQKFTALTHLTLGKGVLDRQNGVLQLCCLAPQLKYLDVTFDPDNDEVYNWGDEVDIDHSDVDPPCWPNNPAIDDSDISSLRVLRIKDGVQNEDGTNTETAVQLLRHSTELKSLEWRLEVYDDDFDDWMSLARTNTGLESLRCPVIPSSLVDEDMDDTLFPNLLRLAGGPATRFNVNHIEVIRIETATQFDAPAPDTASSLFPDARSTKLIPAGVVDALVLCPQLRHLEFVPATVCSDDYAVTPFCPTKWIENKISGSIIRSFHHAGESLYQIRTLTSHRRGTVEVVGIAHDKSLVDVRKSRYAYEVRDEAAGTKKLVWFCRAKAKEWEDATEYKGMVVPLEVIRDMRLAEKAAPHDWEKRGVEVGAKGWKVLKQWAEKQPGWAAQTQTNAVPEAGTHQGQDTAATNDGTMTNDAAGVDGATSLGALAMAPSAANTTAASASAPGMPNDPDSDADTVDGNVDMEDNESEASDQV